MNTRSYDMGPSAEDFADGDAEAAPEEEEET